MTRRLRTRICLTTLAAGGAAVCTLILGSPPVGAQAVRLRAPSAAARDTSAPGPAAAILADSLDPVGAAARAYRAGAAARTVVRGSIVTFPYGHAQPTVTCAVLRVCVIELQPGEIVLSRIAGDTERWEIASAAAGIDGRTTLVVVKPRDCDLTTNLVLATDRRLYDLTLDAPPCGGGASPRRGVKSGAGAGAGTSISEATNPQQPYTRHVRFYYPDETIAEWAKPQPARVPADVLALNFAYQVKRDRKFPWSPAQVFDDGARVYIKLPDEARRSSAPGLFVLEADGSRTLLNYNFVGGDTYVTDRIFDRAVLVTGDGGEERRAVIERKGGGSR